MSEETLQEIERQIDGLLSGHMDYEKVRTLIAEVRRLRRICQEAGLGTEPPR